MQENWMSRISSNKIVCRQALRASATAGSCYGTHIPPSVILTHAHIRHLSPEAIESLFVLYRITGDPLLADSAWRMFESIANATTTQYAHSAIADVTTPKEQESQKLDQCESYWMAETLKYFYLVFSEPDLVSLDEFVL